MNARSRERQEQAVPWPRRITVRTVLLSWLVGVLCIVIFMGFAFPTARRIFLSSLDTKAEAIATAVAAEADETLEPGRGDNLARHCRSILANDAGLVFIAVTDTARVTTVFRRDGVTTNAGATAWPTTVREARMHDDGPSGGRVYLVVVPIAESRAAAAVGVALISSRYEKSMSGLYGNAAGIAAFCALVALLTSIYYARRLASPLKALRRMVQEVADGNLTARAPVLSGDEVGELARSLNAMTEKLQQAHDELFVAKEAAEAASEAKSMFLATVSHEIRTPINGVIGMLKLIKDSPLDTRQQAQVNTAITSARALLSVIEGILDFSKIEAGKIELESIDFNIGQVVDSAVMMFTERANEKHLKLEKKIASGVPEYLRGDPSRISQVLINLVSNAIKFTTQGGITVTVSLQSKAEDRVRVYFAVTDTGIGITKEQQDRLFKAFTQADSSTTRKYGGTGLGLAICKQLVELMGGEINIRSEAGAGTTFWFVLPFQPGAAPSAADQPAVSAAAVAADGTAVAKASILVVEDNNINAYVARELLVRSGYVCDVVVNGEEAVRAFSVKDYDLILMDIQMPVMDGYEATKAIREKERHRPETRVPIVALTANAMSGEKERCLAAGMDDYLVKPLDPEQMNRTIERLLRPDRKPAPGLIGREPVNYDELIQRCMRDEKLARQLLDEFVGQAHETVTELRELLAAGDFAGVRRVAHRIKGTSATLACEHVRRQAVLLESACDQKALPARGGAIINELERCVRDVADWREVRREKDLL